jgi:hypothetical protein
VIQRRADPDSVTFFSLFRGDKPAASLGARASTLSSFSSIHGNGDFGAPDSISTESATGSMNAGLKDMLNGYHGTDHASEVHVTTDGRFVYAANRLHNSIALLAIDQSDETVTWRYEFWTQGDYPRYFGIEPNGNFLYVW